MTAKSHGRRSIGASRRPRALIDTAAPPDGVWTATVLTLYPAMFPGALGQSLTGRALDAGLWGLRAVDMREFATDKHRSVDDTPAGGGAGMVLRADIVARALDAVADGAPALALSPRGAPLTQARVTALADGPGMTLVCGRFEGIDQRVLDARGIEEVSIGDYVLTGGELAAQVLIDACVRLIPRVLGNAESALHESFSGGLLEHPHYTRPATWEGRAIPEVLLSGHHGHIAAWRRAQSEALTRERRPDLWRAYLRDTDPGAGQELSDEKNSADMREQKDD